VALLVSLSVWRWTARAPAAAPTPQLAAEPAAGSPTAIAAQSVASPAVYSPRRSTPVAADALRPVKAANVLYDLRDEGVVLLEDNTPARQVRARYVDTYTWRNPATNASMKWSVPRDEVRVLPASFH
jgi:uroporphyrinogen-III synthase